MPTPTLVDLPSLIDDAKCFELARQHRWPEGVRCPSCGSAAVARHGRDDTQPQRRGLAARFPPARLGGEVEVDELHVVAGHKGRPPSPKGAARPAGAPG